MSMYFSTLHRAKATSHCQKQWACIGPTLPKTVIPTAKEFLIGQNLTLRIKKLCISPDLFRLKAQPRASNL